MQSRASRPIRHRLPVADAMWVCACSAVTGALVGGLIGWLSRSGGDGLSQQVVILAGLAGAMLAAGGLALVHDWERGRADRRPTARITLRTAALVVTVVVGLSLWLGACSHDASASSPHQASTHTR